MARGWIGYRRAAERLGLSIAQVGILADAGELTKRERDRNSYSKVQRLYEVKSEDVQRLRRTLELVGYGKTNKQQESKQ